MYALLQHPFSVQKRRKKTKKCSKRREEKRRGGGGGSVDVARTPGFLGGGTPSLFLLVQGNSSHFCICTQHQHHRPVPSRPLPEALFGYQVQGQRRQLTRNRDGTGISCNIRLVLPCLISSHFLSFLVCHAEWRVVRLSLSTLDSNKVLYFPFPSIFICFLVTSIFSYLYKYFELCGENFFSLSGLERKKSSPEIAGIYTVFMARLS